MTATTRPEDYLGVLQSLTDGGCSYFLGGGQAVKTGDIDERQFLNEIKLLLQIGEESWVRQGLEKAGFTLAELIPIKTMSSSGLAKIERFAKSTWPRC